LVPHRGPAVLAFLLGLWLSAAAAIAQPVGSQDEPILLEADNVIYDTEDEVVTAEGNVQAIQAGSVLLADKVVYYRLEDRVVAEGNVSLTDPDGNVFFGDQATLSDKFQNGLIRGFSALLEDSSRVAAAEAERVDGKRHLLRKGIFSSCEVCEKDGKKTNPTWQIKAVRVVQDQEDLTVAYRDVFLEVKGVPIFYAPYFSHPDPSVKRKSGFLFPTVGTDDQLGTLAEVPYFFALAPNYDVTVSPIFTGDAGAVMKSSWRHRTPFGEYALDGSITNAKDFNDLNQRTDNREIRGHVFGEGRFEATRYSAGGYKVELTNDDTYLRRYNISSEVDLESEVFFERIKRRNYAFISSHYFQGLRANDDPGLTPFVLPRIKAHMTFTPGRFGRINVDGDALVLQRTEGLDSRRVSVGIDWENRITTNWGQVWKPFVHLRGDIYHTSDRRLANPAFKGSNDRFTTRVLPAAGIDFRWPFVRPFRQANVVVEPIVQAIASPVGGNPEAISNEDSETLVFDFTNLFEVNKFPGLDRWEDGQRVNAGFKIGGYLPNGRFATVMFGRNFRFQETDAFGDISGLGGFQSDYVGRFIIQPVSWFSFSQNVRFDSDSLALKLNEVEASVRWWRLSAAGSYLNVDKFDEEADLPPREEMTLRGIVRLTDHWSTFASTRRDLLEGQPLQTSVGVTYRDDCTLFNVSFRRSFFRDRDIQPSDTLLFNVVFKGLGGFDGDAAGSSQNGR